MVGNNCTDGDGAIGVSVFIRVGSSGLEGTSLLHPDSESAGLSSAGELSFKVEMHPRLPWLERVAYWSYYLFYIGIGSYRVYKLTAENQSKLSYGWFIGWITLSAQKDPTEVEWQVFVEFLRTSWRWILMFVLLSRLVEWLTKSRIWLLRLQLALSLAWLYRTDRRTLFILSCVSVVFHVTSYTRSRVVVWLFTVVCYVLMNIDAVVLSLPGTTMLLLFYAGMPFYARNAGFALEACLLQPCPNLPPTQPERRSLKTSSPEGSTVKEKDDTAKHKKDDDYEQRSTNSSENMQRNDSGLQGDESYPDEKKSEMKYEGSSSLTLQEDFNLETHLHYAFYFPHFFVGPMLNFRDFRLQFKNASQTGEPKSLATHSLGWCRILVWTFLNELILELFHFKRMSGQSRLMKNSDLNFHVTILYMLGQFFMTKYVCIYGISKALAKLDGVQMPGRPKCVSYIYLYTNMWRWFDVGLYQFLKRYVFIPMGGSRAGMVRKVMSSAVSFGFIILWHGKEARIISWVLLNFAESLLEMLVDSLSRTQPVQNLKSRFSPQSVRRLRALMFVPLLYISWLSVLFFLGYDFETAMAYLDRTAFTSTWAELAGCFIFHIAFIQVSMDAENYLRS